MFLNLCQLMFVKFIVRLRCYVTDPGRNPVHHEACTVLQEVWLFEQGFGALQREALLHCEGLSPGNCLVLASRRCSAVSLLRCRAAHRVPVVDGILWPFHRGHRMLLQFIENHVDGFLQLRIAALAPGGWI